MYFCLLHTVFRPNGSTDCGNCSRDETCPRIPEILDFLGPPIEQSKMILWIGVNYKRHGMAGDYFFDKMCFFLCKIFRFFKEAALSRAFGDNERLC